MSNDACGRSSATVAQPVGDTLRLGHMSEKKRSHTKGGVVDVSIPIDLAQASTVRLQSLNHALWLLGLAYDESAPPKNVCAMMP